MEEKKEIGLQDFENVWHDVYRSCMSWPSPSRTRKGPTQTNTHTHTHTHTPDKSMPPPPLKTQVVLPQ